MLIRTHAPFTVTALGTKSHGAVVDAKGIDLAQILAGTDLPLRTLPAMRDLPADILVEITTLDPKTGEPAITYIRQALDAGLHVVTANKGPIARAYRELDRLATARGRMLRFEATLADCLPVFTLRRSALPMAEIRANVLMDADIRPEDVAREPIDERTGEAARSVAGFGERMRPLIEIVRRDGRVFASFGPRMVGPMDPLYAVD